MRELKASILMLRRVLGSIVLNAGGKLEVRDEPYWGNVFVDFTKDGWMTIGLDPRKEEIN